MTFTVSMRPGLIRIKFPAIRLRASGARMRWTKVKSNPIDFLMFCNKASEAMMITQNLGHDPNSSAPSHGWRLLT